MRYFTRLLNYGLDDQGAWFRYQAGSRNIYRRRI